ncbi:MAG: hypothetical protein ABJ308_09140 [Halieaceae bacterium]
MSLFEFQMVLLSIIIGLGLSELLTGFARVLRAGRLADLGLAHWCLFLTLLVVLLQMFWESWGLHRIEVWTFPALLLMLGAPILLYLVAHLVFPSDPGTNLTAHYFAESRTIYLLLVLTAVESVLFRPLAFDMPLLVVDNLSSLPTVPVLALLAWSSHPRLHQVLLPLCLAVVLVDTLAINYMIR